MKDKANGKKMDRVVITLGGRRAEVDADQVKLLLKKEQFVDQGLQLQRYIKADPINHVYANALLSEVVTKIQRLNKRIRRTVRFLEV